MRDIIISLKPYYYYLIGEGIKKVEVRKSYPKAEDWSKRAWFYMSRDEKSFAKIPKEFQEKYRKHFGKVGMRFVCDRIDEYPFCPYLCVDGMEAPDLSGYEIPTIEGEKTGLDYGEAAMYGNRKTLYFWHISDLAIYDKPRELGEFRTPDWYADCDKCHYLEKMRCPTKDSHKADVRANACRKMGKPLTRPFQSWGYVQATEPRQTAD